MSFGPHPPVLYRRAAEFVDKILRGAKPAEIPIEQPTKFELIINLKTAKGLGLTVPPTLLATADAAPPVGAHSKSLTAFAARIRRTPLIRLDANP